MERREPSRPIAASLAVAIGLLITVVGGAWFLRQAEFATASGDPDGGDDGASGTPWQVLPGTFQVNSGWLSGPYLILPGTHGCFVAFGQDDTGTAMLAGYWRSTDDCSETVRVTPPHRPIGDSLPSYDRGLVVAAVPAHDGGYLAMKRRTFHGDLFAYETQALRVDPYEADEQRRVQRLAEFSTDTPDESHIGPIALAATSSGYVAVGRHDDDAVAWTSTDAVGWQEVRLPDAGLGEAPRVSALAAGAEGRLVAVGSGGSSAYSEVPAAWLSTDAGASWSQARMPQTGARPHLGTVVYTGDEFVALGTEGEPAELPAALVLTSPDGVEWTRDDSLAAAGGLRISTATTLPSGEVLAIAEDSQASGEDSPGPDERCAAAWLRGPDGWAREPIGCQGVPTGVTTLADGSVAAVHWSTLFLRPPA